MPKNKKKAEVYLEYWICPLRKFKKCKKCVGNRNHIHDIDSVPLNCPVTGKMMKCVKARQFKREEGE